MDDNNTAIAEADARLAKRASLATQALRCLPSPLLARGTLATTDAFDVVISNQAVPMSIFHSSGALDVAALRSQLAPSPVGFADSYEVNENKRVSLERADDVVVRGLDLTDVLAKIERELAPNMELRAEFHKLLLYEEGAFFGVHRDSSRGENHILSLVIDVSRKSLSSCSSTTNDENENTDTATCEGGAVVLGDVDKHYIFKHREADKLSEAELEKHLSAQTGENELLGGKRPLQVWRSAPMEWGAWHTSTYHSVTKVRKGYRAVLTYDVFATPRRQASEISSSPSAPALPAGGVSPFPRLVWEEIARIDLQTRAKLLQCNKALNAMLGGQGALFAQIFDSDEFRRDLSTAGFPFVGFVASHTYNAEQRTDDLRYLKGCDRIIANALQKIGFSKPVLKRVFIQEEVTEFGDIPRIRVGPATLKGEEIDNLFDAANELRWARSRMDEYQIAELEEEKSEQQLKFAEMVGIPKEHVDKVDHIDDYEVRSTWTELDYFERVTFVLPFYGLFWGHNNIPANVRRDICHEDDSLWGNARMFSMRVYESCALIFQVAPLDACKQWTKAADFKFR